ncbi:hypothetical protein BDV25DRAFT_64834 [Aspergillus avenaceus]|uniref:Uncharacterized protein n=1 Tax=Aspergillus avenaceus TaxID=36643 RepID=A0A5N6UA80_ASPAV|nr:hypothetical protein BDV25DRAFT_64834 [Aspergillus avenaceus]
MRIKLDQHRSRSYGLQWQCKSQPRITTSTVLRFTVRRVGDPRLHCCFPEVSMGAISGEVHGFCFVSVYLVVSNRRQYGD